MTRKTAIQRIDKLRKSIDYHRYLYHVKNKEEISADALDSLKHELFLLEQEYPDLIIPSSPTQRVAGVVSKGFKKYKHKKQMVSLEDIFTPEEFHNWEKYLKRMKDNKFEYFAELKIDGFAISLIYRNRVLFKAVTRGDSKVGEDVTSNIKTIQSIPLKLNIYNKDFLLKEKDLDQEIEIRGEVYMTKSEFKRINKEKKYSNPRNLAAGTVRQLDSKVAEERNLEFLAYDLMTDLNQKTHDEKHKILSSLGFKSDKGKVCKNAEEVISFWKEQEKKRENHNYLIDGVVVSVNDNDIYNDLGIVGKTPRAGRALKFKPRETTTKIINIILQVGRTGAITPVAVLSPCNIDGAIVSRATLHNQDQIDKLDVRIGDTVIVQRAGDVIPAVSKVLKELRVKGSKKYKIPNKCPICNSELKKEKVAYRCVNKNCPAMHKENIYHFVSKQGFNIDGLGPEIVDSLLENKVIKNAGDIFEIKKQDILFLERFGEKSSQNLIDSINNSKEILFDKFIYSLGIRHVGVKTSYDLAKHFKNIDNLKKAELQELLDIDEIGEKSSETIYEFFNNKENLVFISKLIKNKVRIISLKDAGDKLKNKTFVLTGTLTMSRDLAKQKIMDLGGKVSNSISVKTDFLVCGINPGSKENKAKKLGVKILNEEKFLKCL